MERHVRVWLIQNKLNKSVVKVARKEAGFEKCNFSKPGYLRQAQLAFVSSTILVLLIPGPTKSSKAQTQGSTLLYRNRKSKVPCSVCVFRQKAQECHALGCIKAALLVTEKKKKNSFQSIVASIECTSCAFAFSP